MVFGTTGLGVMFGTLVVAVALTLISQVVVMGVAALQVPLVLLTREVVEEVHQHHRRMVGVQVSL